MYKSGTTKQITCKKIIINFKMKEIDLLLVKKNESLQINKPHTLIAKHTSVSFCLHERKNIISTHAL